MLFKNVEETVSTVNDDSSTWKNQQKNFVEKNMTTTEVGNVKNQCVETMIFTPKKKRMFHSMTVIRYWSL